MNRFLAIRCRLAGPCMALLALSACGGGGGGGDSFAASNPTWTANRYPASSEYIAQCAAPRTGTNPATGAAYADKKGSIRLENFWLRSWTHELYLWYQEVVDRDPALYGATEAYFETLKTTAITASGKPKDQFHFTYPTSEWIALSQSGISAGYGLEWAVVSPTPPRVVQVAYVENGSPAAAAGLTRGAKVLAVDGIDVVFSNTQSAVDGFVAGLYPEAVNESHSFTIEALNGSTRSFTMTAAAVAYTPVPNTTVIATASGPVGYILFNDHLATAERGVIDAFTQLKNAAVQDLVLDLRYNGGGFVAIASQVAYMIAGDAATSGKTFERSVFNDQYAADVNPATGGSNSPTPFYTTSLGFSVASGMPLPTLNLARVFVLTGADTCSASESIINGLLGVGVQVIQIGNTTCGKPYGFYSKDNCGTTYFSIQLQGVNDAGFGNYADGFSPSYPGGYSGEPLPGCTVADDLGNPLGNTAEKRLAAALFYRLNGYCSPALSVSDRVQIQQQRDAETSADRDALRPPRERLRDLRILNAPGAP